MPEASLPDLPFTRPRDRDWGFPEAISLLDYPALVQAWNQSRVQLSAIQSALEQSRLSPDVETVAVVGSLGRMEASTHSDCDLIVILNDSVPLNSTTARDAYESVWAALAPLALTRPKPDGIYAAPASSAQLLNSDSLGKVNE